MQNDTHPLIEAMRRAKAPDLETFSADLPGVSAGQAVELSVTGVVKSLDKDGRAIIEVQNVEQEQEGPEEQQAPQMVTTQDSNVPS